MPIFERGKYTKEELLIGLRDYYNDVGFPTSRGLKFSKSNKYPTDYMIVKAFGSMKTACELAGISIPKERESNYDRIKYSRDDLICMFSFFVDDFMDENEGDLPNFQNIDQDKNMPSSSVYLREFGGLENLYNEIGYDYHEYKKSFLRTELIIWYYQLLLELRHPPSVREIEEYSRNGYGYSASAYRNEFGSINELRKRMGYKLPQNIITLNKTDEELINELITLGNKLNRMPGQLDIVNDKNTSSCDVFVKRFGSMEKALHLAGYVGEKIGRKRMSMSPKGKMCRSIYEYDFCCELENNNICFETEIKYRSIIPDCHKNYRFDYVFEYGNNKIFIEICGMLDRVDYAEKMEDKIKICQQNNINLICLTPNDFYNSENLSPLQIVKRRMYNMELNSNSEEDIADLYN